MKSPGTKGLEFVIPSVPATGFFDGLRFKRFITCKKNRILNFAYVKLEWSLTENQKVEEILKVLISMVVIAIIQKRS